MFAYVILPHVCGCLQIEFPLPDAKTKRRIFGIHTSRMTLSEDVNLEEFVMAKVGWQPACHSCKTFLPAV
jgi:ATP-dependent 26S proteasome regulatory subunit